MTENTSKLNVGSEEYEFAVKSGSVGPDVIDIGKLYGQTGLFTLDPGFTSTASCESKITYIDGDQGVLLHRGYPIDSLAKEADYLEVCYILLNGSAPTQAEYDKFTSIITTLLAIVVANFSFTQIAYFSA